MRFILLNFIFIVLISVCFSNSNITGGVEESSNVTCTKCSPCWNVFSKNYGPCSTEDYDLNFINPFNNVQPICVDTLILLIILFLSIVILIPTCLWLIYLSIKRFRNINGKYVVNGRIIS